MSKKRRIGQGLDTYPFSNFGDMNKARPTWEDMIIAYSTIPGYASIRDHHRGTWFIQSLVEVFMNHAHDREIIDLLRMTSQRLSRFTNEDNEKQTCNIEMRHLYKRIYFNPGLPTIASATASPKGMRRSRSTPPASPRRPPRQISESEDED
jgi:UDP:flavonoid glycosyltransferase YjiC (YdhE family)